MKDPSIEIRKAVKAAIVAAGYNAYSYVSKTLSAPYIYMYNQSFIQSGLQDIFGCEAYISLDIVTQFQDDSGGMLTADTISNAILDKLIVQPPNNLQVAGFNSVSVTIDGTNDLQVATETHIEATKTIRLKFILFE